MKIQPEPEFKLPLDFYCYPLDTRACFMYDKKGNVAGIQTSFLASDVSNVLETDYNLTALLDTYIGTYFLLPAYSYRVYLTNPEKLTTAGREVTDEIGDGLWFYINKRLIHMPKTIPDSKRYGDFFKQGCMRSVGQHYFYKVDKTFTDCKRMFPFFTLYDEKNLVGYGLVTPGQSPFGKSKDLYSYPTKSNLSMIAPNRPQCFDKLQSEYNLTSMHVYFVKKSWDITCNKIYKDTKTA